MLSRKIYILLFLALTMLAFPSVAAAVSVTHLNVPQVNFVTLTGEVQHNVGTDLFYRVRANGNTDTVKFNVPSGKVLIITDIDWFWGGADPHTILNFFLKIRNLSDPSIDSTAFFRSDKSDANGLGGANIHLTGGVVISAAAELEVYVAANGGVSQVAIHGYLANAS